MKNDRIPLFSRMSLRPQAARLTLAVMLLLLAASTHAAAHKSKSQPVTPLQCPEAERYVAAIEHAADARTARAAVEEFITTLQYQVPPNRWNTSISAGQYEITFIKPAADDMTLWYPTYFDSYVPASKITSHNLRRRITTEGPGVPFVGLRQNTPERNKQYPYLALPVIMNSVTCVVEFPFKRSSSMQRLVRIRLVNPLNSREQVASDLTAPFELIMKNAITDMGVLQAFLRPFEHLDLVRLYMLEPYDPKKIPVVFVHGLASAPKAWVNTINELLADPVIRQNCQFWGFRYPTGNPVLLSAALLRKSLQGLRDEYDSKHKDRTFDQMVIIGHSMGGMLTRLMVTESGDCFWRANMDRPFSQTNLSPEDRALLKEALFFKRQPYVKRVIFIATPHRGSPIAKGSLGRLASKLVEMPGDISNLGARVARMNPSILRGASRKAEFDIPTSIDNFSPNNRFVLTYQQMPIPPPYHTIMGNRGVGKGTPSTDGIVPYWSSHLAGAESEILAPAGHSCEDHPLAILEIQRILRLHLETLQR
ncbi:MAG: hypothetical protein WCK47_01790 [bacterium]